MDVENKVREILSALSGKKAIDNDTTLQGDLALDSLAMVAMLIEIEEVFGIRLKESDMNPFNLTTAGAIDMIQSYYNSINDMIQGYYDDENEE